MLDMLHTGKITFLSLASLFDHDFYRWIWGSHGGNCEDYGLLGCNAM
jgi:hypothetical protein